MTDKELGEEIEVIVKDLCKFGGRQDKYALEVVDEIKKRLEILGIIKKGFSKDFLAERLKDAYLRDDLNDEEYGKITEWLDNDR